MGERATAEVTGLLHAWRQGDREALDHLMPLVQDELHRLAHGYMQREPDGHLLQTTALVNEAYIRLIDARELALFSLAIDSKLRRPGDRGRDRLLA